MGAAELLVDEAIELVERWLVEADRVQRRAERRVAERLHGLVTDPDGVAFTMRFVDRVVRPESDRVAAHQLHELVAEHRLPAFLGPLDRTLLRTGAGLAPHLPRLVMPLARRRLRALVGHLVVDADDPSLAARLEPLRADGFRLNVNLLGEAVLGEREARRRRDEALRLLAQPDVDYVSVKVSGIVSQLAPWDHEGSIARVSRRLRPLYEAAAATDPPTFVNLDMEEYHDLELTLDVFTRLLDEPALHHLDAGIAIQAYLPDALPALERLVTWATARHERTHGGRRGGRIKIRLVKGANLAMERVEAAMRGWPQAPYDTKADTDANYRRCVDWALTGDHTRAVTIGLASHNLFDVAWARLLSVSRGVDDRIEFEMLQGMAPAHARTVRRESGGLLLYTPVVDPSDFDVAISYLFRRLEENAAADNFIRHLFTLRPGTPAFEREAGRFRRGVAERFTVATGPRRRQDRRVEPPAPTLDELYADIPFANETDTDPALPANRAWAAGLLAPTDVTPRTPLSTTTDEVDRLVATLAATQPAWAATPLVERRAALRRVAAELSRRRGDLVAAMVHEASKPLGEADPEVSEAVDFARYYAECCLELAPTPHARFDPFGVVCVVPPWNFPVAIPTGGTMAALAAGNTVVLKPAPETPRCAEIVAECCAAAGLGELVGFIRVPDDEVGRHLVTHPDVDAVVLTGAWETARLFLSWRPDMRLFAETSGKNAIVITPAADLDLAVADLVRSAFGHGGQKCSAASLAICVGEVYGSARFRRQLVDAVTSLRVGPATDPGTTVAGLIGPPGDKLGRALGQLEPGEAWLVEPRRLDDRTWTPGVKIGVSEGSWFHRTECFGPVLGVMAADDLDAAIRIQNGTDYGLTGGLHSLDPDEIAHWVDAVEVGNAYVNRTTTGAIVRRQPFGGWKRSSVGPGAKAGGPNYVRQFGTWTPTDADRSDEEWLAGALASDEEWWRREFGVGHDPTGLFCESNVFRYRPRPGVMIRRSAGAAEREVKRVEAAAARCGVPLVLMSAAPETPEAAVARAVTHGIDRIRLVGPGEPDLLTAAARDGVHVVTDPVTAEGRVELLHHLREQSVSRTLHRYGNLI